MSSQDYAQAYEALDKAAGQTTRFLTGLNIRHGFIGGYATSLIGGRRITYDIDIIIDADPKTIQTQLVENCQDFTISSQNKLHFQSGIDTVTIEMLRGGGDRQLKLPDPKTVELVELAPRSRPGRVESTFSQLSST
ncbi:unnamed protein product [Penicillium salamii]|uniref:Uncharacterized protein n=1 Tax=Penicillium salamii TaxID=1612424 RepID=A0A9W4NW02_9EURO|nr:unnamed protein product [Penicillium salamii]CAG8101645.1 unnamed protein product [Penicillium salamii]CAG8292606.1 unnamed protein product [Penicillium salamii]CAG8322156.1 unnamed protein product [Penicillium salamii]CAG8418204.1 unnamed protein product [Penicillium salamii]